MLDGRFRIHAEPAEKDEHYTHVWLKRLQQDYRQLTDAGELERIVSQHLPCKIDPKFAHANDVSQFLNSVAGYQEFSILVKDDNEVFKSFSEELERPRFLTLRDDGEEYARVWYCSSNRSITINQQGNEFRGFRLRINNFAVGPTGIYDDEDGASFGLVDSTLRSAVHLSWHVGEIHITHPEIVPDTPRSALELDSVARRAVFAIRRFYKDRIADSRALSDFKKFRTVLDECERMFKTGEVPSPEKLSVWIVSFAEQDRIARDRSRSQDEVKKRLREYLLARDTKLQRQKLANWARGLGQASTPEDESPHSDTSSTSAASTRRQAGGRQAQESGRSASRAAATTTAAQAAQPEVDFDQLLSDIIAVIEAKLGTDDENYLPLCRAIEDIFRKGGLTE